MPSSGPREIVTPFRPIPLDVPEGMKPNEFFNSTENLNDLVHNNGLLQNPEGLLLYRKALGHSNEFDTSIIYNTSQTILDPLGRPVRRTQVPEHVKNVWNRMNQVIIEYMLERYPDPDATLVLAGEASLDATWPLTSPGVPSIRMLHNHSSSSTRRSCAMHPSPIRAIRISPTAASIPCSRPTCAMTTRRSSTSWICKSCGPARPVPAGSP